jgi:NAD(P)-dependent dehydrogenase (short-subunit alcohol dehydrogenase family)
VSQPGSAVVTGAARGLGAAVAARLLEDGWSVVLVDRDPSVVATADELAARGLPAIGVEADVADPEACQEAVALAGRRFGRLRALVNNAGVGGPSTAVHETDPREFRHVIEVNLVSALLMVRAAVPAMLAGGEGGSIVSITSVLGQRPEPGSGAYSASKAALALLGQTMALELAADGIRVNSVAPGNMLTDMHREHVEGLAARDGVSFDAALDQVRASVPLGRHGTPDDVGDAVAWLVSERAAYVTGQTVAVNGGILLS